MSEGSDEKDGYEVGYRKPPRHTRWVPGQSGFSGRRKKEPERQAEIIARIRDEEVTVGGKTMTKFELAVHAAFNNTIKNGRVRELTALLELLDKYGAIPKADMALQAQADAEQAMAKISRAMQNMLGITPEDVEANRLEEIEEVRLVMNCPACAPTLRSRWAASEYRARLKRQVGSALHSMVQRATKGRSGIAI